MRLALVSFLALACGTPASAPASSDPASSDPDPAAEPVMADPAGALLDRSHHDVATMAVGDPELAGTLHADQVQDVFTERGHELSTCYEHVLAERDLPRGRLLVAFTVRTSGAVAAPVTIDEDGIGSPFVAECVTQTIADWH